MCNEEGATERLYLILFYERTQKATAIESLTPCCALWRTRIRGTGALTAASCSRLHIGDALLPGACDWHRLCAAAGPGLYATQLAYVLKKFISYRMNALFT